MKCVALSLPGHGPVGAARVLDGGPRGWSRGLMRPGQQRLTVCVSILRENSGPPFLWRNPKLTQP